MSNTGISKKRKTENNVDGQHFPVDRIHIGQDTRVLRRPSQIETTSAWCGQAWERGRLKAKQGKELNGVILRFVLKLVRTKYDKIVIITYI